MADWAKLPEELLDLISKQFKSQTDILRFRSVCSSWRSSIKSYQSRFPTLPNAGMSDTTWGFYLSKRTIFRLGLPYPNCQSSPSDGWLIKLERDNRQRLHLMNPLTGSEFYTLSSDFPRLFDFSNLRVLELGQEYALQYINYRPSANSIGDSVTLYMEKVAFCSGIEGGFVLLTIHVSGKLAALKSGEKKWTIIDDLPSPYDDVILYQGEFYAVDSTGRTVIVVMGGENLPAMVKVVANSVFGGDKKFLVESLGELLLVDKYLSVGPDDDSDYDLEAYENFDCFMSERTVKFEVFRLDKREEKWAEVKNLGDRMLFLGDNCEFSALASDFPGCKGNCIFFTGQSRDEEDGVMKSRGVGVFDLESGSIEPIANYPRYSELFWPPPPWLSSIPTMLEPEVGLNQLSI